MKKIIRCYAFSLIVLSLCACSEGSNYKKTVVEDCDSVMFATIRLCDTTNCPIGNDKECVITANVEISYPKKYVNKEKTDALQQLFSTSVLGVPSDSVSLATAFPQCLENMIARYEEFDSEHYDDEMLEIDYDIMTDCKLMLKIYPVYNAKGLLGFCKQETVIVNDEKPMIGHYYYAFDLTKLHRIELSDLFPEENNEKVSNLLKNKLRDDKNVMNDDELVEMGYYNFENLMAVDNFYVTSDSVIWNFLPRELSVVEEVRISLDRSAIKMLSNNN